MPVIAIDGPAGSGKTTVARTLAARLSLAHLDTGAMYRSVTLAAVRRGIDPHDAEALEALAAQLDIEVGERVLVDGEDATSAIRAPDVTAAVSAVSSHPGVRAQLVRRQRAWVGRHGGGVLEGRDIGTVVLPDADVKVFLTASAPERARRRGGETGAQTEAVAAELARRDAADSSRSISPLRPAEDAVVIDTTGLTVDEVVNQVLARL